MPQPRIDARKTDALRPIEIQTDFLHNPLASTLIAWGKTRVLCSISDVPGAPRWKQEQGKAGGWITAEYRMLPGATPERSRRESAAGGPSGRTHEIQRLIGRSLRAVVDLELLGDRTLYVDCDVLDADGGTRCAAVTGAAIALELALRRLFVQEKIRAWPLNGLVAAVSVGIVDGEPRLDLCYEEDSRAEVDMNVVMTEKNEFVELQGTAEGAPFARPALDSLIELAQKGLNRIFALQRTALGKPPAGE